MKRGACISLKHNAATPYQLLLLLLLRRYMWQIVLMMFFAGWRSGKTSGVCAQGPSSSSWCFAGALRLNVWLLPHTWGALSRMGDRGLLAQNVKLSHWAKRRIDVGLIYSVRRLRYSKNLSRSTPLQPRVDCILVVQVHIWLSTLRAFDGLIRPVNLVKQRVLLLSTAPIRVTPLLNLQLLLRVWSPRSNRGNSRLLSWSLYRLLIHPMMICHVGLHHNWIQFTIMPATRYQCVLLLPVVADSHLFFLLVALSGIETWLIEHVIIKWGRV